MYNGTTNKALKFVMLCNYKAKTAKVSNAHGIALGSGNANPWAVIMLYLWGHNMTKCVTNVRGKWHITVRLLGLVKLAISHVNKLVKLR